MTIKIRGGKPNSAKFQEGKIIYVGKVKFKETPPTEGVYPRNDLYPANDLFPTNEG